jgi:hypothetical protein
MPRRRWWVRDEHHNSDLDILDSGWRRWNRSALASISWRTLRFSLWRDTEVWVSISITREILESQIANAFAAGFEIGKKTPLPYGEWIDKIAAQMATKFVDMLLEFNKPTEVSND